MRWIRSPLWDGFWMLSGLPIGLVLALTNVPPAMLLSFFFTMDTGHLVAPIAMAWAHRSFRQTMLRDKLKYIVIPVGIIAVGAVCGATVGKTFQINPVMFSVRVNDLQDYLRPLIALLPVFFVWNAYHYGMQNYGLLRFFQPSLDRTTAMQWAMFTSLFGLIILPQTAHIERLSLFLFGAVILNHQLAAIGLASHIWANHWGRSPLWFAGALIAFGSGLAWLMVHGAAKAAMTIIGLRVAAGFAHFLYDRWVYKLSHSEVRTTIGRDLFCHSR